MKISKIILKVKAHKQGKSKTGGQTSLGEKKWFGLHLFPVCTVFIPTSFFILSETGAQQEIIYINNGVLNFCLCYLTLPFDAQCSCVKLSWSVQVEEGPFHRFF
jgi:hypothetical protein